MEISTHYPFKRILLIVGCLIMMANLTAPSIVMGQDSTVPGGDPTLEPKTENTLYSAYIPCLTKCENNTPVPFAVQIAGLSDFINVEGLTPAEVDQLKMEKLAEYNKEFPAMVQAISDSGAGWARVYVDWSIIQPVDPAGGSPTYYWTNYDNWLGKVAAEGVQIIATVSNPPTWAAVDKSNSDTCTNMVKSDRAADYYNFLGALVNRYRAAPYKVSVWEVFNEPDAIDGYRCNSGASNYGNHGADYAAIVQGASQAIKATDPTAKVIMGGIAYDWFHLPYDDDQFHDGSLAGKFNRYFTDDIMANGAASYVDGVNIHFFHDFAPEWERWTVGNDGPPTCGNIRTPGGTQYYPYGLDVVAKGSHFQNRLITCFNVNKPLWITEVGMHGIDPTSPYYDENLEARYNAGQTLENQARYVFKVFTRGLSIGAENVTWYAIKIIPEVTPGDFQGLLYDSRDGERDGQPKPAYYAFQTYTHEMKGYTFVASLSTDPNIEIYSFANSCQGTNIVAWVNQEATVPYTVNNVSSVSLTYRPQAVGVADVTIVDGDVNDLDMTVNGSITFGLTIEPVIIHLNP